MREPVTIDAAAHRPPTIVKIGGAAIESPDLRRRIARRIADLHHGGGRLVLVHGGGGEVDRLVAALGMKTERRSGIRVTPPEQMAVVAGVLAGRVNTELVASLVAAGVPAVGLTLCDSGLAGCRRISGLAFDPGRVGEVLDGDPRLLEALLDAGHLPVIASIGADEHGELLNVNADVAAAGVARIAGAAELLILTDVPGVRGPRGEVEDALDASAIDAGIERGWIEGGMIPKVRGALAAAESSGIAARIAGWDGDHPGTRILSRTVASSADDREPTPS